MEFLAKAYNQDKFLGFARLGPCCNDGPRLTVYPRQ